MKLHREGFYPDEELDNYSCKTCEKIYAVLDELEGNREGRKLSSFWHHDYTAHLLDDFSRRFSVWFTWTSVATDEFIFKLLGIFEEESKWKSGLLDSTAAHTQFLDKINEFLNAEYPQIILLHELENE